RRQGRLTPGPWAALTRARGAPQRACADYGRCPTTCRDRDVHFMNPRAVTGTDASRHSCQIVALYQSELANAADMLAMSSARHTLFLGGKSSANCNRVAGFAAAGSSLDQRVREGAGCWPPGPSCVSPVPQLKREWSPWPEFGWFSANLRDFSKA